MRDNLILRLLYRTIPGRFVLKILVQPWISVLAGRFLDSKYSVKLIRGFQKRNRIDLREIEVPEGGFRSFNEFFCRKRKSTGPALKPGALVSPCDAYLSCVPIRKDILLSVKHAGFTLEELLQDKKLAEEFRNGYALIFRLTPAHYHRFSYAADGLVIRKKRIQGELHCVRPIATKTTPVYVQNTREYEVILSEQYGKIIQMEVGALLVGRIHNHNRYSEGRHVRAGSEKGYFEFGGSTIILLLQSGKVQLKEELLRTGDGEREISIRQNSSIRE